MYLGKFNLIQQREKMNLTLRKEKLNQLISEKRFKGNNHLVNIETKIKLGISPLFTKIDNYLLNIKSQNLVK
jgi:hypothetical protein